MCQNQELQLTSPRETAAEENATAYYPILDRVSEGYFDEKTTEQALYTAFVDLLKSDGHITQPEALASFDLALSIRSAAPRIEAHYQFYNTSVEPSLKAEQNEKCEIWASFHGKQYCSVHLDEPFGDIESERYVQMAWPMADTETQTGHTNYPSTAYLATARLYLRFYTPISPLLDSRNGTRH